LIKNTSNESSNEPTGPTQVELYDDLRRIGELEHQKQAVQPESKTGHSVFVIE